MAAEDTTADVVVCGVGMAGVSTAHFLTRVAVEGILLVDCRFPLSRQGEASPLERGLALGAQGGRSSCARGWGEVPTLGTEFGTEGAEPFV